MPIHRPTGLRFNYPKPWKHQIEACAYLYTRSAAALYTKPGSGKTRVFLDLIRNKGWSKVLVVATKNICVGEVWEENASRFTPNIETCNVGNVSGKKKPEVYAKALQRSPQTLLVVINYDSVWREPFRSIILNEKWDAVICDESHRIKSPGSRVSKFMSMLTTRIPNRYLCTGTPLYSSPEDVYAQYRFCEPKIFGTRLNDFRDRYENIDQYVTAKVGYRVLDKKNPYKNMKELHEKIMSIAYHVDVDLSLPQVLHIPHYYTISAPLQKHLKTLNYEHYIELESGVATVESVLTMLGVRQQLMSGYVKIDGKLESISEERFEVLYDLLETLGDEPVVIFARYRAEIDRIRKHLGERCLELSGKVNQFPEWKKGRGQYLIVQPQAGSEGVEMFRARYTVYFSKHPSLGLYNQSTERTHRPGQTRGCVYYHIIGKGRTGYSVDETILAAHQSNQETIDYIMTMKRI